VGGGGTCTARPTTATWSTGTENQRHHKFPLGQCQNSFTKIGLVNWGELKPCLVQAKCNFIVESGCFGWNKLSQSKKCKKPEATDKPETTVSTTQPRQNVDTPKVLIKLHRIIFSKIRSASGPKKRTLRAEEVAINSPFSFNKNITLMVGLTPASLYLEPIEVLGASRFTRI